MTSENDTYLTDGARCARAVIDRFSAAPHGPLHAGCAARIPHIQTPGNDPRTLAGEVPATVVSGPPLPRRAREAVTAAVAAFADLAIAHAVSGTHQGVGLRGGTDTATAGPGATTQFTLRAVRWVRDAAVSGTGTYRRSDGATRARLVVHGAGLSLPVAFGFDQRSEDATAHVGATTLRLSAP